MTVVIESQDLSSATLRKISLRLIPFLFLLYIVAWLDRVNVGFAALQMNSDLKLSAFAFGFGSGIFFAGYCLFEVPSNIILDRVGARLWIGRIMISWGIVSVAMMFVREPISFCVLRFLLGAAEAGFFPGVIYYLSKWYPAEQRARAIAAFMAAVPVTGLIGGPLSGFLLGLDGVGELRGWQWLFLLEGLPAIVLGVVALFYLTDSPADAGWLTAEERNWLTTRLTTERDAFKTLPRVSPLVGLTDRRIWLLGFIFLLAAIGFYGYSFWSPIIIKSLLGIGNLGVGIVSGAFSAITIVGMLFNGMHSDKTGERRLHIAIPLLIMSLGLTGCALLRQPWLAVLSLALVPLGHCGAYGPFWSMPSRLLTGPAAASGVALVATIASVGGFLGPTLIGALKDRTGTHVLAFFLLGAFGVLAGLLALLLPDGDKPNPPRI
jgi:ACS family tartrate transporter-like MFS transporter